MKKQFCYYYLYFFRELSSIITNGNRAFLIQLAIKINELRNSDKTDKKLKEIL